MSSSGWIKIHRSIQEHWVWDFREPDKAMAWIDLILSANHKENTLKIKNTVLKIDRGQLAISQKTLQKRWKWSQNKIKRFLKVLKSERMIEFETNALTTVITICNYDDYQVDGDGDERATCAQTDDQANDQANDKQECKNVRKNIKPKKQAKKFDPRGIDPNGINMIAWAEWIIYRESKKKPISEHAARKQTKFLLDYDLFIQQIIIDQSIANDWQGLFPPKNNQLAQTVTNKPTVLEKHTDRSWADSLHPKEARESASNEREVHGEVMRNGDERIAGRGAEEG